MHWGMQNRYLKHILVVIWVTTALAMTPASANELRIITSYQSDMVDPIVQAFALRHPDLSIRLLNKNTHAAVDEVLAGNERHFDIFWASAPEAFVVLDEGERLNDVGHGAFLDFAYSAVGWTWRTSYDGYVPQEWNDLLDPILVQDIAISHPLRSGTTHSLLETILQDRGWQAGWAWILELAGQLNTISARSYGVLEGIENGDFSIGLTIDFLALTRSQRGLVFRYGRPVIVIPARIAALKGGSQPVAAHAFMEFILSPEGQRILLNPDIRRIPVDPEVRAELAESLDPSIRAALNFSWSRYDPELAAHRYWQINQLFEAFIARDLLLRRELWRRLRAVNDVPAPEIDRVRQLLTWMPITEHQALSAPQDRETLLEWAERSHGILRDVKALIRELERQ